MDNKKNGIPKLRFPGFTGAWEQRRLGEVAEIKTGSRNHQDSVDNGKYPFFVRSEKVERLNEYDFDTKAILVPGDGRIGEIFHYYDGKFALHQRVYKVDNFKEVNPLYLLNLFKYKFKKHALRLNAQGTVPSLRLPMFTNWNILIPNLNEQQKIGLFFQQLDSLITLHQRKLEHLQEQKKGLLQKMFPKNGEIVPEVRFPGFTDAWEQRKLGEEFKRVNERNNGEFGKDRWISVAKMYFQDPDKVTSNNIDTRTYVMRFGDIAFEGHPNNEFKFGRFVANDIGDGVVSELFPIYRHIRDYDNNYWKYAIHLERIMGPIFAKSITSSGNSSNKLAPKDLLRQSIFLPHLDEQKQIGDFFKQLDSLITLHQRKLDHLELMKKGLLQQMFV